MCEIIGRKEEIQTLQGLYASGKPELVVVYGRRRVGKTFLIKRLFGESFAFYMTGLYKKNKKVQLSNFAYSLSEFSGKDVETPADWTQAFRRLRDYLIQLPKEERKVVFIDELPWLDTQKSDLLTALDLFWNGWANNRNDIMLIVCGSATSWITDKFFSDKGGLFNRDTLRMYLSPFTLKETEEFLLSKGLKPTRYEIMEYYMVMGGIPYYLDKLQRGKSLAQNIDNLFFKRRGPLWNEYRHLYDTLFKRPELYCRVVEFLSRKASGYTRSEIMEGLKIDSGGDLTKVLRNLCDCDMVRQSRHYGRQGKDCLYKLTDFYTLFYFKFIKGNTDEHFWENNIDNPARRAWTGYAFEQVCQWHVSRIKQALGISGISCSYSAYRYDGAEGKVQIDLLIDRRDNVINICEIKFSKGKFAITSSYADELNRKMEIFKARTKTRKSLHLTLISPFGLASGKYASLPDNSFDGDILFA